MFCFPNSDHVVFTMEFTICNFINYTYICRYMHMHRTKFEINSSLGYHLTRPEMEKQNTLAKRSVATIIIIIITIKIMIMI